MSLSHRVRRASRSRYCCRSHKIRTVSRLLLQLREEIVGCQLCPRLRAHCTTIAREKRRAYRDQEYWGRPVPSFGDPDARVLVLGLAPGAHGSNRTGRPFTGDGSGYFLYPVLHEAGFASQAQATHRDDGLKLRDLYITSVVRCAPPQNKPLPQELARCAPFLDREIGVLKRLKVVVVLGKIAFDGYLNHLKRVGTLEKKSGFVFAHAAEYTMPDGRILLCSFHPSLQNTNTGRLTRAMMLAIFQRAAKLAGHP